MKPGGCDLGHICRSAEMVCVEVRPKVRTRALMRIVQISDTHLSRDKSYFLDNWAPLAAWIADHIPIS